MTRARPPNLGAATVLGPADGVLARGVGGVCAILTADCRPLVFATGSGDMVAAARAGWRGLAAGVIEARVRAMGVLTGRLIAWLGPAIGRKHFEVGAEVRDALLSGDAQAVEAFAQNARGRFMADLGMLARRRLETLGMTRIYGGGGCALSHGAGSFSH